MFDYQPENKKTGCRVKRKTSSLSHFEWSKKKYTNIQC